MMAAVSSTLTNAAHQHMAAMGKKRKDAMEKFEKLSGVAAPMPLVNIDTDMIIPKVF